MEISPHVGHGTVIVARHTIEEGTSCDYILQLLVLTVHLSTESFREMQSSGWYTTIEPRSKPHGTRSNYRDPHI